MFRLSTLAINIIGALLIGVLFEGGIYIEVLLIVSIIALIISTFLEDTYQTHVDKKINLRSLLRDFISKITEGLNIVLKNPKLRTIFIIATTIELTGFMSWIYIPSLLSLRGLHTSMIGFVFSIATIARAIGIMLGFLADRCGVYKLIIAECITSVPYWYIIALINDPYVDSLAYILNELLIFSSIAISRTLMSYAPKDSRGIVTSTFSSLVSLTSSGGVILGGLLFKINISLPYLITGTTCVIIAVLILITRH